MGCCEPVKGLFYSEGKGASSNCKRTSIGVISLVALAIIALVLGVLALAGVGHLSQMGNIGGGTLLGVSALLSLSAYCISSCRSTKSSETLSTDQPSTVNPIPTYDELIARHSELREMLKEGNPKVSLDYLFESPSKSDPENTIYEGMPLSVGKRMMNGIRGLYDTYCKESNFTFSVKIVFSNKKGKEISFSWPE